jgi:hypothetical protein
MPQPLRLTIALLLSTVVAAAAGEKARPELELHVVSLRAVRHDPDEKFGEVTVQVNRPGKTVSLVLAGVQPIRWTIEAGKETTVEKIYTSGVFQTIAGIPEERITRIQLEDGPRSLSQPGTFEFQSALRRVINATGRDASSFYGAQLHASGTPVVIDKVTDDKRLRADYPQPVKEDELPKLRFPAVHLVFLRRSEPVSSYGEFTLAGPVEKSLRPMPKMPDAAMQIAHDAKNKRYLAATGMRLFEIDFETKTAQQRLPDGPQPRAIAFDSRRERFLLMEGVWLWIYNPANGRSSILTRFDPQHCAGVAWSAELDCIYTIQCGLIYGGAKPYQLRSYDAEGKLVKQVPLKGDLFPGIIPEGSEPPTQLIAVDKHLVMITHPDTWKSDGKVDETYIYLIDPESGQATLTARY